MVFLFASVFSLFTYDITGMIAITAFFSPDYFLKFIMTIMEDLSGAFM